MKEIFIYYVTEHAIGVLQIVKAVYQMARNYKTNRSNCLYYSML